jgi:hypothetical protein
MSFTTELCILIMPMREREGERERFGKLLSPTGFCIPNSSLLSKAMSKPAFRALPTFPLV